MTFTAIGEFPSQELGLALSIGIWMLATLIVVMAHGLNEAGGPLRLAVSVIWIMASVRMYSASSFLWAADANDAGLIPALRLGVVAVLTIEIIVLLALTGYYWNRWRRA